MPVTLAQAQLNALDDIQAGVIDETRKASFILDQITFDDSVTPGTNGGTLVYGYQRLLSERPAAFRQFNTEYTPAEATKVRITVDLKPLGARYGIDRALSLSGGLVDEIAFQTREAIKSTRALAHWAMINGDAAAGTGLGQNGFDGIDKAVTGTTTELGESDAIDLSDAEKIDLNKHRAIEAIDELLSELDGRPTFLAANRRLITKLQTLARIVGYKTEAEDAFGRKIIAYDGIPLQDLGEEPGSANDVAPLRTRTVSLDGGAPASTTGLADLYAVRLGMDGVHAVSIAGAPPLRAWLPDFTTAGAVKDGEIEMGPMALAIRRTRAAGVRRNFKVQP